MGPLSPRVQPKVRPLGVISKARSKGRSCSCLIYRSRQKALFKVTNQTTFSRMFGLHHVWSLECNVDHHHYRDGPYLCCADYFRF